MRKKVFLAVLGATLLAVWGGAAFALEPNGEGTYEIGTEQDLAAFRDMVNAGSSDIDAKLTANIALTQNWKPIGYQIPDFNVQAVSEDRSYKGTFDGNGKTVSGLKVVSADAVVYYTTQGELDDMYPERVVGFFGIIGDGAQVKNLKFSSPDIDAGNGWEGDVMSFGGTLAGVNIGGQISGVEVSGGSVTAQNYAGGLVAMHLNGSIADSAVKDCSSIFADALGDGYPPQIFAAGGIAGYSVSASILNCAVTGVNSIVAAYKSHNSSQSVAGGIVGQTLNGNVAGCTVRDIEKIIGDSRAGGIVGSNGTNNTMANCGASRIAEISSEVAGGVAGSNEGAVFGCTAEAITAMNVLIDAGGIVGYNHGGRVANCTAKSLGTLVAFDGEGTSSCVGGVVGNNDGGEIVGCAVSGIDALTCDTLFYAYAGGVVGMSEEGSVSNCRADGIGAISGSAPFSSVDSLSACGGVIGRYMNGNLRNCTASGIGTLSAAANDPCVGGVVGETVGSVIQNCALIAGEEATVLSADAQTGCEGGVIGSLNYEPQSLDAALATIQDCAYPQDTVFENGHPNRPVGNVSDDLAPDGVVSYDATAQSGDLPAVAAAFRQGAAVTIEQGKPFTLDVTTLPGTSGDLRCTWTTESADVVSAAPADAAGMSATLTGNKLGTANVTCAVSGDTLSTDLTCAVTVVAASIDPQKRHDDGDSSSGCSAAGFGLALLSALPLIGGKKK